MRRILVWLFLLILLFVSTAGADTNAHRHHIYIWVSNGDGTHTAQCMQSGCGYSWTHDCTFVSIEVAGEAYELCPVCGQLSNGTILPRAEDAEVFTPSRYGWRGREIVLRGTIGEATVISFAYEKGGIPQKYRGSVTVRMPSEPFSSLHMKSVGGVSDSGLTLKWTEDHKVVFRLPLAKKQAAIVVLTKDAWLIVMPEKH